MQIHYRQEMVRKLLHLSSIWMVLFICFYPKFLSIILFGSLLVGGIIAEYGYHKKWAFFYPVYQKIFKFMLRSNERSGKKFKLSGGIYVIMAAFIASLCFTMQNAAIALTIMLVGDTAASLIGRKYGKTKITGNKSLEGSCAFFAVAYFTVVVFGILFGWDISYYIIGLLAACAATLAELYSDKLRLDDNLTVVIATGAVLSLNLLL